MKTKQSNEYKNSSSKRSKKKRKKEKKKQKKEVKKSKHKSSSSSNDTGSDTDGSEKYTWVEKEEKPSSSSASMNEVVEQQKPQREEWMNLNNLFPCTSKSDKKAKQLDSEKNKSIFDKPGQSGRELNPYWKDGGTGLPQIDKEKLNMEMKMDVNWLKKSLQRAKERATEEGKSLEEIAAERWGSLETIQLMIEKAEARQYSSNSNTWKKNRHQNNKNYNTERRNESYKRTVFMQPDYNERNSENKSYVSHSKRESYKRPRDETGHFTHALHESTSRRKNWKKSETLENKTDYYLEKNKTELEKDVEEHENDNIDSKSEDTQPKTLVETDMNKLGAKIIKAEMMGQDELAAQLKLQLEEARKVHVEKSSTENTVILTKTDARGITRPIQPRNEYDISSKQKKKKAVETHSSGERIRYYPDDDKYSLQELFQREKGATTYDNDAAFTKIMSKNMDMNDIFEQQISQTETDIRQDKRERNAAIKEHQRVSRSIKDCRLCIDSKNMLKHMIVTMDSDICLSLPSHISLTDGHCILTPVQHVACQLHLDENVWEKLMAFKKTLNSMFMDQNQFPIFFETYKNRHKFPHMQLECIPVPKDVSNSVPMYFKKALLECETEWSTNKKIIDLHDKNLRKAVPNGLAYFAVEFGLRGGYAHVIEDERLFPANFAQETIAGILELDYDTWRKPRRENFDQQKDKVIKFTKMWEKYNKITE